MLKILCGVIAIALFLIAAFKIPAPIDLTALGLAFLATALVVPL